MALQSPELVDAHIFQVLDHRIEVEGVPVRKLLAPAVTNKHGSIIRIIAAFRNLFIDEPSEGVLVFGHQMKIRPPPLDGPYDLKAEGVKCLDGG